MIQDQTNLLMVNPIYSLLFLFGQGVKRLVNYISWGYIMSWNNNTLLLGPLIKLDTKKFRHQNSYKYQLHIQIHVVIILGWRYAFYCKLRVKTNSLLFHKQLTGITKIIAVSFISIKWTQLWLKLKGHNFITVKKSTCVWNKSFIFWNAILA